MSPDMHELRFALGPTLGTHWQQTAPETGVSDEEAWMMSALRRPLSGLSLLTCHRRFYSFIHSSQLFTGHLLRGTAVNKTDRTPRLGDGDIPVAGDRQDTE